MPNTILFIYVVISDDECWELVDTIPPPAPQVHYPSEASGNWFKIYTYFVTCCFTMVDQLTLYVEQLADTYTSFACQNLYKIQLECMQEDYILGRCHEVIHIEQVSNIYLLFAVDKLPPCLQGNCTKSCMYVITTCVIVGFSYYFTM